MTIKEKKEKLAAFIDSADVLQAKASKDGTILGADERLELETYLSEAETLSQDIAEQERQHEIFAKVELMKKDVNKKAEQKVKQTRSIANITADFDFKNDPKCGYANSKDFMFDVYSAGKTGQKSDNLKYLSAAGSDEMSGISDPYGGFLIPQGFSDEILSRQAGLDPTAAPGFLRNVAMDRPMLSISARVDNVHTTSVSGGTVVARRIETSAMSASRVQYEQIDLKANSIYGLAYATNEQIADSPKAVSSILSDSFNEEFRVTALNERLWGTGTGEREGIMNSPALISITRAAAGNDIDFADIINMRSRCWGYSNAIWLANPDVLVSLANLASADNAHIWLPSARVDAPNTLLGAPLFFTDYCETSGTSGDIILFNGREYLEASYQPIQNASSIHVRFVENESCFRWTARNDGRGWWRAAFTPPKSSTTRSPFVTLADA